MAPFPGDNSGVSLSLPVTHEAAAPLLGALRTAHLRFGERASIELLLLGKERLQSDDAGFVRDAEAAEVATAAARAAAAAAAAEDDKQARLWRRVLGGMVEWRGRLSFPSDPAAAAAPATTTPTAVAASAAVALPGLSLRRKEPCGLLPPLAACSAFEAVGAVPTSALVRNGHLLASASPAFEVVAEGGSAAARWMRDWPVDHALIVRATASGGASCSSENGGDTVCMAWYPKRTDDAGNVAAVINGAAGSSSCRWLALRLTAPPSISAAAAMATTIWPADCYCGAATGKNLDGGSLESAGAPTAAVRTALAHLPIFSATAELAAEARWLETCVGNLQMPIAGAASDDGGKKRRQKQPPPAATSADGPSLEALVAARHTGTGGVDPAREAAAVAAEGGKAEEAALLAEFQAAQREPAAAAAIYSTAGLWLGAAGPMVWPEQAALRCTGAAAGGKEADGGAGTDGGRSSGGDGGGAGTAMLVPAGDGGALPSLPAAGIELPAAEGGKAARTELPLAPLPLGRRQEQLRMRAATVPGAEPGPQRCSPRRGSGQAQLPPRSSSSSSSAAAEMTARPTLAHKLSRGAMLHAAAAPRQPPPAAAGKSGATTKPERAKAPMRPARRLQPAKRSLSLPAPHSGDRPAAVGMSASSSQNVDIGAACGGGDICLDFGGSERNGGGGSRDGGRGGGGNSRDGSGTAAAGHDSDAAELEQLQKTAIAARLGVDPSHPTVQRRYAELITSLFGSLAPTAAQNGTGD
ncbi:unnamed protein product [Phaeothamnion confervicola]